MVSVAALLAWAGTRADGADTAPRAVAPTAINPRYTGTPTLRMWRTDEMGASTLNWRAHEMGASAVNWRTVIHPRTGFLYVANNEGVFEFDGLRWRMIRLPDGRSARDVLVAPDGQVWATGPGTVVTLEPGR